jgi:pimeloyl-ACP methyl ester carboxylesterase
MPHGPIPYDPTVDGLVRPESRPPLQDLSIGWQLDQICAELSRLAYIRFDEGAAQKRELTDALIKAGFSAPVFFGREKGAQAFGTESDKARFLSFRGTQADKFEDLISDIDFLPCSWGGQGVVHHGFWTSYQTVAADIDSWLQGLAGKSLVITGHSLGAALATLMAARHEGSTLVTFGSPRVGSRRFAGLFKGRSVRRYVDCTDFVTTVPPPFGARHLEGLCYVDRHGHVFADAPNLGARMLDRLKGRAEYQRECARKEGNVPVRFAADHAPINYVSALLGRRTGP